MNTPFFRLSRLPLYCPRSRPVNFVRSKQTRRLNSKGVSPLQTYKMAAAASTVSKRLKDLSLTTSLPKYPNCYPEVNPVDIYRAHLTSILTEVTGVDAAVVYPALQWTQTLEKGDLVLPIPALRVKGKKPPELAAEWVAKVINFPLTTWAKPTNCPCSSFLNRLWYISQPRLAHSYNSSSKSTNL
jgi:hypothetical protein